MIDALLPGIENVRAQGALVLLKWDGERTHRRCTVVITRQDTDFVWRRDTDDIGSVLLDALTEYEACHAQ